MPRSEVPLPVWFHERQWVAREIRFADNPLTWKPIKKLSESPSRETKQDADEWGRPPFGAAEFLCQSVESPSTQAYLTVYLQVPYLETQTEPAYLRAEQATLENLPSDPAEEMEAWRRLEANNVTVTGRLLSRKQEVQGNDDPVPGGWSIYLLASKVPGTRLAEESSVLKDGMFVTEGYFWTLDRETRDLIRHQFASAHQSIYRAQVNIGRQDLRSLYWDEANKRLYVHGQFGLPITPHVDDGCPFYTGFYGIYGLAHYPYLGFQALLDKPVAIQGHEQPLEQGVAVYQSREISVEDLEALGWIF